MMTMAQAPTLMRKNDQPTYEEKWPEMRPTILKLLNQESVSQPEYHDLFYNVYAVCQWDDKGTIKIKDALQEDIIEFIKKAQLRVLTHKEDEALLKAYIVEWRRFLTQSNYLPAPFKHLEAALLKQPTNGKKPPHDEHIIRKLMLDSWNLSIFNNIKQRLQDSAMKLVQSERNGEAFDSQLVIGVRESYVNLCSNFEDKLQIYRENFEKAYLESTETFYKVMCAQYLSSNGVQNYMRYAEQKLREEEVRANKYLESEESVRLVSIFSLIYFQLIICLLQQQLVECCVKTMVTTYKTTILAECPKMLVKANESDSIAVQSAIDELKLMFKLMDRVPDEVSPMLHDLDHHIVSSGLADMFASAEQVTQDSEKYVEHLLDLFTRFSTLVTDAFGDDPRFLTVRDKAFKHVVNDTQVFRLELPTKQSGVIKTQPESKCPELLANYCDMLLRRTPLSKRLTSDEIEAKLRDVLLVLKYIQNKDVFMRYHKAHLTRRLILDTSADSDKEESMVEWLREVGMPADFVNKLARMFQDIKVSEDLNAHFKDEYRTTRGSFADSISIKILNAGAWARGSERVAVSLPLELEDYIPEVEEFYKKKHSGRKLQWYHHMSNGTITFANDAGCFDLDVTTFQMAVLFAWNQRPHDRITYENLRLATELPDPELKRTLWSLVAFPKLKKQVLQYEPVVTSAKDFDLGTNFWINQEFCLVKSNKSQKRGKINLIGRLQLSTERSREEDNEGIVQLRILRVQEAIIKILKMRKKITNAQLQTELIDILKNMFLPTKKMIKEQVEWLIEHKYLRRDDNDLNVFYYIS